MKSLKIHIKNCYGIGSLDHEIDLSKGSAIIYAPNGIMKSSLTHVFQDIVDGKESGDRFYTERDSERDIKIDGIPVTPESIYVFENINADGKKSVSSFLSSPELKRRYDEIHQELAEAKKKLMVALKKTSGSSDIEGEILNAFRDENTTNVYDCLLAISNLVEGDILPVYAFKYNDVFDKKGQVKDFLSTHKDIVLKYFEKYQELLDNSSFFSNGKDSFGTNHAQTLISSVRDDRFFKAKHLIVLKDGSSVKDKKELEDRVEKEISVIYNDQELLNIYKSLENALAKNADLRKFKEAIKDNPAIINRLVDYEALRKDVIVGYIQNHKDSFVIIRDLYSSKKDELRQIIQEANNYTQRWENIVNLFNARFFVPFEAKVSNLPDVLLNEDAASLIFEYKDEEDVEPKILNDDKFIQMMSQGEVRAYNIMQNLFIIESFKEDGQERLIVMDDIADSFDFKNKYAILEYIHDILNLGCFKALILTHNFDFYRTAVSRLQIGNLFFAYKKDRREIVLGTGLYRPDLLKNKIITKAHVNDVAFISLIPFARNIVEYAKGTKSEEFKLLTSCLHSKPNTTSIKKSELVECIKHHVFDLKVSEIGNLDGLYLDILADATNAALNDPNEIEITNKIVLSIAIRIKAEQYIKTVLSEDILNMVRLNNNQTGALCDAFKKHHSATKPQECLILNKVMMLTSENIHLNNFMFEPIVDMPITHLKQLYNEVEELEI